MKKLAIAASLLMSASAFAQTSDADSIFGFSVEQDVTYGQGAVRPDGQHGDIVLRDLKMDVYYPAGMENDDSLPAIIYVHGGGHHRGGKFLPPFRIEGAIQSSPQEYGRNFAAAGYVTFVPEYRLAPEWPEPDHKPGEANLYADLDTYVDDVMLAGVSRARAALGLETAEGEEGKLTLWKAGVSAFEDAVKVVDHLVENAETYNIDPSRIAMGGHSAGGGISMNAAYGFKAPLAAIFPMSGAEIAFDASVMDSDIPPTLLTYSQNDDRTMMAHFPRMIKLLERSDAEFVINWVPGFGHSYPFHAPTVASDGTRMALFDRITSFLDEHMQ
ncbi:alpha/beta hydrolase [Thaumasiovibrio sp. DFM-14]|uniref:alpha/beta hydrolase n=1 Tax=Thaumasiovibrio sp. DFM-14 TaxID=3384792 RepID=UPI0039A3C2A6